MYKELTRSDQSLDQGSGETIFQKGKTGRGAGAQIEATDSSLEKDVAEFENKIIDRCKSEKPEIIESIQSSGKLDDDKEKMLVEVITRLKGTFKS